MTTSMIRHSLPFAMGYIPLVVGFAAVFGAGTWWGAVVVPATLFVMVPAIDAVTGHLVNTADDSAHPATRSWPFDLWLWLWLPAQVMLLVAAMKRIELVSPTALLMLAGSMGLVTGIGINVAHELMHRRGRFDRALAELLMMSTTYTHFCVEHVLGHHKHVATPHDPASSVRGDILYRYWLKTVFGGLRSAWRLETKRTSTMNLTGLRRWHDRRWRYPLAMALVLVLVGVSFGALGVVFFLAQSLVAVLLLETINYVEHYGLTRRQLSDGSYERCMPGHSWNAPQRFTHWLLFALQRHSDHHHLASRPYFALRHREQAPQLPAGYPAMVVLSLVPPLWRLVMDPRVDVWHSQSDPSSS
jgi:alkane 1-monooxygenase